MKISSYPVPLLPWDNSRIFPVIPVPFLPFDSVQKFISPLSLFQDCYSSLLSSPDDELWTYSRQAVSAPEGVLRGWCYEHASV